MRYYNSQQIVTLGEVVRWRIATLLAGDYIERVDLVIAATVTQRMEFQLFLGAGPEIVDGDLVGSAPLLREGFPTGLGFNAWDFYSVASNNSWVGIVVGERVPADGMTLVGWLREPTGAAGTRFIGVGVSVRPESARGGWFRRLVGEGGAASGSGGGAPPGGGGRPAVQ